MIEASELKNESTNFLPTDGTTDLPPLPPLRHRINTARDPASTITLHVCISSLHSYILCQCSL